MIYAFLLFIYLLYCLGPSNLSAKILIAVYLFILLLEWTLSILLLLLSLSDISVADASKGVAPNGFPFPYVRSGM